MKELDHWLNQDTWHTGHPLDNERFNKGVFRLLANHSEKPSGEDVLNYIVDKLGIDYSHHHYKYADSYANKYEAIAIFIADNGITI